MVLLVVCALLALLAAVHVLLGRYFPYFWRDARFLCALLRYGLRLERFKHTSSVTTVLDRFVQQARRLPLKAFVLYDGRVLTYRDVDLRSNRLANVFLRTVRVRTGETVAILMNNEPDFLCVWFGLSKVGCSVAFLNTNIRSGSLLHCFRSCGAKTLIVGAGNTRTHSCTRTRDVPSCPMLSVMGVVRAETNVRVNTVFVAAVA